MSTFQAQGLTFTKSSKSDTDWTRNCVGVYSGEIQGEGRFLLADSVTRDILGHFPLGELAGLLASMK